MHPSADRRRDDCCTSRSVANFAEEGESSWLEEEKAGRRHAMSEPSTYVVSTLNNSNELLCRPAVAMETLEGTD